MAFPYPPLLPPHPNWSGSEEAEVLNVLWAQQGLSAMIYLVFWTIDEIFKKLPMSLKHNLVVYKFIVVTHEMSNCKNRKPFSKYELIKKYLSSISIKLTYDNQIVSPLLYDAQISLPWYFKTFFERIAYMTDMDPYVTIKKNHRLSLFRRLLHY